MTSFTQQPKTALEPPISSKSTLIAPKEKSARALAPTSRGHNLNVDQATRGGVARSFCEDA